jgi:hypothetical protein
MIAIIGIPKRGPYGLNLEESKTRGMSRFVTVAPRAATRTATKR